MEETFTKVVENIFTNWTALTLAIDNGMAGPNYMQTISESIDYMAKYCLCEENVQINDIAEALEDILDEEFNTICEDGSPKEIATVLFKFVSLLKEGNLAQFEVEYNNLPLSKVSLSKAQSYTPHQGSSSSQDDVSMVEDDNTSAIDKSEWTEVRSRRKH
ncbi:uncharacterized protein LOC112906377 [Agrilus planipennis]|uniref:Pre-rRNA-processing protein TSR2 homolog n=1 Tax=Agrilus planipennis TaxID=224129 RepID=A0A7F5RJF8_AGRPL|nr:uncharacterized protein LOC112906377 [Agrilus planipennis]